MALSHGDHKRIAGTIAQELRKVLSDANGERLLKKHQDRLSPKAEEPAPDDLDAMAAMGMGDGDAEDKLDGGADEATEDDALTKGIHQLRKGKKGFPPKKGGGGHGGGHGMHGM